jgi:hypothetical protein
MKRAEVEPFNWVAVFGVQRTAGGPWEAEDIKVQGYNFGDALEALMKLALTRRDLTPSRLIAMYRADVLEVVDDLPNTDH